MEWVDNYPSSNRAILFLYITWVEWANKDGDSFFNEAGHEGYVPEYYKNIPLVLVFFVLDPGFKLEALKTLLVPFYDNMYAANRFNTTCFTPRAVMALSSSNAQKICTVFA